MRQFHSVQNFEEIVENKFNFESKFVILNSYIKVTLVHNVTLKSCFPEIRA